LCDAAEERRRGGIGELVAESLAEDQAERARPAHPQSPGRRVGAGIAELLRGLHHFFADFVRDELGPAERLRRAANRYAGTFGNVP
jgi:hypothetical protein